MKRFFPVAAVAALLLLPAFAQAQGGCVNSPENPSAILGLAGLAGAAFASWRSRRRS